MGRSVNVPSGAVAVVFLHVDWGHEEDYADFIEDLRAVTTERYPSFDEADGWCGQEGRIVLQNGHAAVVVSEYCGVVSVALVPHDDGDFPELQVAWCQNVGPAWREYLETRYPDWCLRRIAIASNGESLYKRVTA